MSNKKNVAGSNKRQRCNELLDVLNEIDLNSSYVFKNLGVYNTVRILSEIVTYSLNRKIEIARKKGDEEVKFFLGNVKAETCKEMIKKSIKPFANQKKQMVRIGDIEYEQFLPAQGIVEQFREELLINLKPCRYAMFLRESLFYDFSSPNFLSNPIMDKFYVILLRNKNFTQDEIATFAHITLGSMMKKISQICEMKLALVKRLDYNSKIIADTICELEELLRICKKSDLEEMKKFLNDDKNFRNISCLVSICNTNNVYLDDLIGYFDDIYELIYTYS